jgi:hypothetical protein
MASAVLPSDTPPNAFSRSIAATSSGLCIASLRGNSPRGACTVSSILRPSPQRGGPVLNVAKCPVLSVTRQLTITGVNLIVAAGLVAAIGDVRRFTSPQQLVSYVGLNPRVRQSGLGVVQHGAPGLSAGGFA